MIDIKNLADFSSIAEASYLDFDRAADKKLDYSNSVHLARILDIKNKKDFDGKFSATQANSFVSEWTVIHHQKNTESGFSATLFKNGSGEYVLGIRGTELSFNPFNNADLLSTDLGDIVYDGLAIDQIIDLYNYWQQLTAAKGSVYIVKTLEYLSEETINLYRALSGEKTLSGVSAEEYLEWIYSRDDIIIDNGPGGKSVRQIVETDSDTLYDDDRREGLGINGLVPGNVDVTGHSLGGHLATAFSRLFPELNASAYSINGAGFATGNFAGLVGDAHLNIDNLFSSLGGAGSFDSSKVINLFADKNPEFISQNNKYGLEQQGDHQSVFIESGLGHGAQGMTDSLAVYELFMSLDGSLLNGSPESALSKLLRLSEAVSRVEDKLKNKYSMSVIRH